MIFHCSVIAASTSTICSVQIMDGSKILIFCQTKRAGDDLTREMRRVNCSLFKHMAPDPMSVKCEG